HVGPRPPRRRHVALTGFAETPAPPQPNFGSIVAKHRGANGKLPPFFSIANGVVMDGGRRIEGYGGGTLSQAYHPFLIGCSEAGQVNVPALRLLDGLNPGRVQ